MQQAAGGAGDFPDSGIERVLIRFGRLVKAADLADKLESGGADFVRGDGRSRTPEYFDAAAHGGPATLSHGS